MAKRKNLLWNVVDVPRALWSDPCRPGLNHPDDDDGDDDDNDDDDNNDGDDEDDDDVTSL